MHGQLQQMVETKIAEIDQTYVQKLFRLSRGYTLEFLSSLHTQKSEILTREIRTSPFWN